MSRRRNNNFFIKVEVSSTEWSSVPQASWNFTSVGIALLNESLAAEDVVEYKFSGETTDPAGDLTPGLPSAGIIFDNRRENKIWLRRKTEGSAVTVRVEAWRSDA